MLVPRVYLGVIKLYFTISFRHCFPLLESIIAAASFFNKAKLY